MAVRAAMARKPSIEVTSERPALFRVVLVEDEGVDLAAQRIEAEAARPVNEQREFVVGRVDGDGAPDESEIARVVERGDACDGCQLGAGNDRAHG